MHQPPPTALLHRAADHAMAYPYKFWGFGEDIALRGLFEIGKILGAPRYVDFVRAALTRWCHEHPPLRNHDHVVPGVPLLLLYRETGDALFLDVARELGTLYTSFPNRRGVPVHRPDLPGWNSTIWVDCMYMDAPFLLRLWRLTGEDAWLEAGLHHASSYASALRDPASGLFWHGYDTSNAQHSPCLWGRGNGWAMLGLIDTLEVLPEHHPLFTDLRRMLIAQTRRLIELQHASGAWHTVLTDASTPLENSTTALFATGLQHARRLRLLPESLLDDCSVGRVLDLALAALWAELAPDGALMVSSASAVGDRDSYARQPNGVFPWGQGPALLAAAETLRWQGGERSA